MEAFKRTVCFTTSRNHSLVILKRSLTEHKMHLMDCEHRNDVFRESVCAFVCLLQVNTRVGTSIAYAFSWTCYYMGACMYECVIQVHSCPHSPRYYYYTLTYVCLSTVIRNAMLLCCLWFSYFFSLICIFFSFSLDRVHTHTHTGRAPQIRCCSFFFLSLIHSFRLVFFVCSGAIMRFAFLSFDFFSPFSPFHHQSPRKIPMYTYTHIYICKGATRQKTCFLLMLMLWHESKTSIYRCCSGMYWFIEILTSTALKMKNSFLQFKRTQIILFYSISIFDLLK